jgi:DNA-binding NtrC family response regulator
MIPEAPSSPRILLVDDEIQQLWLRAQVMTLSGFPVLTADSPNVALSMVAEEAIENVELVVLDYQMPDMNGCDLADLLKEMAPDLKIILYSGSTDIPCSEMSSIDAFVSKGDGISRLIAEVARLSEIGRPTAFTSNLTLHSGAQA